MILLAGGLFVANVNAATFLVNTTLDTQDANPGNGVCADSGGLCSLRAAITEANALPGADTINLPPGTYTQTLAGAENNNASGDWDINSDISIIGGGPLVTVFQANALPGVATERVLHVRFVVAGMVVNISGVTIQNGRNAGNVFGAGIRMDSGAGTLNLDNVIVRDNRNASSGGGISLSAAAGSTLNIFNSTITDNIAGSTTAGTSGTGGGIHINNNPASLNIFNSTISNNTATSGITFGLGGGIGCNGTVNIEDSTISGNTAASSANSAFGGGLYTPTGTTTLTNTTISNNNATSTAGGAFIGAGGGSLNLNSVLFINLSRIINNTVSHAHAAIRTLASTAEATTALRNSTISGNSAPGEGGGVANISGAGFNATTTIENSTISGNSTTGMTSVGGGVINFSSGTGTARSTCLNSTLSGNTALASGGNVHNQQNSGMAIFDVNFCTIANGTALIGGGINSVNGQVNLKNSIIAGGANTIAGTITSQNYNHVQNAGTFIPMANDVTGSDPLLGPLQNNGGNTLTHLPSEMSPVINTISVLVNDCGGPIAMDQRSRPRPEIAGSNSCDKGSVELQNDLVNTVPLDFNGDGRTDFALVRDVGSSPSGATDQARWFVNLNGTAITFAIDWGLFSDTFTPADFNGDGIADFAIWREVSSGQPSGNAFFYILESGTNTFRLIDFGQSGDKPLVLLDLDGDGLADPIVYRNGIGAGAQSFFYIKETSNNPSGNITQVPWGISGDEPFVDKDEGSGFELIVRRANPNGEATFFKRKSTGEITLVSSGLITDEVQIIDIDGDGRSDIVNIRKVDGLLQWWVWRSSDNELEVFTFGKEGDFITTGDFDGDGKSDIGIWRPGSGGSVGPEQSAFWIRNSSNGSIFALPFGQPGDVPPLGLGPL